MSEERTVFVLQIQDYLNGGDCHQSSTQRAANERAVAEASEAILVPMSVHVTSDGSNGHVLYNTT